jgi:hypothetical protein
VSVCLDSVEPRTLLVRFYCIHRIHYTAPPGAPREEVPRLRCNDHNASCNMSPYHMLIDSTPVNVGDRESCR